MSHKIVEDAKVKMEKSLHALKTELTKLRTGRAHPSLLEHIRVDYYGTSTPLSQVSSIAVEDSRTLMVTPWEKTMIAPIEKAIMTSDLGLNPSSAGMVIRVPLPALTEERRKELTKVVREEAERARVAVRNIRRESLQVVKELLKDKQISEDEERRLETTIQKTTDDYVAKVDALAEAKAADMMSM